MLIDNNESTDKANKLKLLSEMYAFCTGARCRHQRLVEYFGQAWDRSGCNACDICQGTSPELPDSTVLAQKILSCVVRTGERYGAGHVADVLLGKPTERAVGLGHDGLSTFGLIPDAPKGAIMGWIDQLVAQDLLHREPEYRVVTVTPKGWELLRSEASAVLYDTGHRKPTSKRKRQRSRQLPGAMSASGTDPPAAGSRPAGRQPALDAPLDPAGLTLFDKLRALRRTIAEEQNIPAFMVCGDRTLRDMARRRPTCPDGLLGVHGIGRAKLGTYGEQFLELIRRHA
jgi:ATP-dependent DNA helicase RecQ